MARRPRVSANSDDALLDCLRALRPEGATGFEGLRRLLMEAWTGRRFRLARGGEQYGHDAKTDPGPLAPTILVECKKYEAKNKPASRELMGEIGQALTRFPTLDLWVLVATTEIGSNTLDEVVRLAEQHAVEVLVVDTREGGGGDLPLLCAAYPEITIDFLVAHVASADRGKLTDILDGIRATADFAGRVEELRAKPSGLLLGFDDARRRMADWLRDHVAEQAPAKAAFGQDLALREQDIQLILRKEIFRRLNSWRETASSEIFSLLGEEGTGKSWAAMAWLLDLATCSDCPLLIPATSNIVHGKRDWDRTELVAHVLHRSIGRAWEGTRSEQWWQRRVKLWWQQLASSGRPQILILLDGLNEVPGLLWRTLLGDESRGRTAILLTCRKPFWDEHLAEFSGLKVTHLTEGYDEDELRQAVAGRVNLSQIPDELRALMRRPRYCDLVVRHFQAMIAGSDFTIARLLFEDKRDRYHRRVNYPFSPQEFDEVLRGLAAKHRDGWKGMHGCARFGKRELRGLLPRDDAPALQELIDGGVLTHLDDPAYPYRVEHRRLVYGLGMLLASDVRQASDGFAVLIEEWFEPQRDMDIKTEILGAAVFFTLPTHFPSYPSPQRRALLRAWLTSRNMPPEQEAAIAAYLPDCAEDMLAEADGFFGPSGHASGAAQSRLGKAIAARRTDPRVLPNFQVAAGRWAGYVRDGQPGSTWVAPQTQFGSFEKVSADDLRGSGLQVFLFGLVQAGPREPFLDACIRAALSAGFISGRFVDARALWALRLTDKDLDELLWPLFPAIAAAGGNGDFLLRNAVGSRRMRDGVEIFQVRPVAPNYKIEPVPGWVSDMAFHAQNPNLAVTGDWTGEIPARLNGIPVAERITGRYQTGIDLDFDRIEPIAAALAPDTLGQFLRSVLISLPKREVENLFTICLYLPKMIAVAEAAELKAIASVLRMVNSAAASDTRSAEAEAFLALAMGLPAAEAADIFLARPPDAIDLQQLHHWFRPQSAEVAATIHARLTEEPNPRRLARLVFVAGCAPQPLTLEQRAVIAGCLVAEDDDYLRYSASLYTLASQDEGLIATILADQRPLQERAGSVADRLQAHILAHYGQDVPFADIAKRLTLPDLATAVLARGTRPAEVAAQSTWLNGALTALAEELSLAPGPTAPVFAAQPNVLRGVSVPYYSEADREEKEVRVETLEDWKKFARRLQGEDADGDTDVDALKARFVSFSAAGPLRTDMFPAAGLRAIHRHDAAMITGWAEAACALSPEAKQLRFAGSAFFQSLAAALVHDDPALGFRLWRILRAEGVNPCFYIPEAGTHWMTCLPFQAPHGPEALAVRREILDHAITDREFLEITTAAWGGGCRDWLLEAVSAHLAMKPLWRRGKGLALAALADLDDAAFESLVAQADVDDTWVGDALTGLRAYHDRNQWARHWYRQFLIAPDRDKSYAGFVLFLHCADRRCRLWMEAMEAEVAAEPGLDDWRVRYRLTNEDAIATAMTENEKPLAETLMGMPFKKAEVIPYGLWLAPDIQIPAA
jgi:hypothetical protein